ncbi:MAG: imidazole glycerol phosphate synthase subunit HisH [Pyrinomonadaceae bacterium]
MKLNVIIVDYGTGNLNSVKRSLDILGISSVVSSDPKDIANAEKIILPGVGHFGKAMSNLKRLNLLDPLHDAALVERKPILGICLGMELMAKKSEEGNASGLGWFEAEIIQFNVSNKKKYKVPHMGWNQICIKKNSSLMKNVPEFSEFYFVHSYHLKIKNQSDLLNETEYEVTFPSAIEKDNIFGVQYHPEKSHDAGLQLLKNFIEL